MVGYGGTSLAGNNIGEEEVAAKRGLGLGGRRRESVRVAEVLEKAWRWRKERELGAKNLGRKTEGGGFVRIRRVLEAARARAAAGWFMRVEVAVATRGRVQTAIVLQASFHPLPCWFFSPFHPCPVGSEV